MSMAGYTARGIFSVRQQVVTHRQVFTHLSPIPSFVALPLKHLYFIECAVCAQQCTLHMGLCFFSAAASSGDAFTTAQMMEVMLSTVARLGLLRVSCI